MPVSSVVAIVVAVVLLGVLLVLRSRQEKPSRVDLSGHRAVPCPKCGSVERVVPVVYGPPTLETLRMARERKLHLGGTLAIEGGPDCHCLNCAYTYFSVLSDRPITVRS